VAKQLFTNNSSSLLAVSISTTDTAIQVASGFGAVFPTPTGGDWFMLSLEDNNANTEITKCTSRAGDVMTVVRAQEGTLAQAFNNTVTRVELRPTAGGMQRMLQRSGDTLGGDLELGGFAISGPGSIGPDVSISKSAVFSVGMIMMWSGSIGTIPLGWALCNGSNGTPDLRDRFVVGAGSSWAPGDTGGAASELFTTIAGGAHTPVAQGTTLSVAQMPAHSHSVYAWNTTGSNDNGNSLANAGSAFDGDTGHPNGYLANNGSGTPLVQATGGGGAHTHVMDAVAAHTHTGVVDTMPPYYALAYIMFTGVGVFAVEADVTVAVFAQVQ